MRQLERGRIEAVDLGRQFRITSGGGRSLKATLLRREAPSIHEFWALRHVTLDIEPGEAFGVVGRNGSGKSTFLKMLARIYGPTEGHCAVGGRMSSLIELGAGFHPEFNAIENVFLSGAVYGIPKQELERDLADIIGFAELDEFAYQPIKTYSSGMFMRLGFSVAMHVRPDVLLLDEVLAVGDERFVQKCLGRIAQFRREGGTMLLVTHDPGIVKRLCQRAMLLDQGEVIKIAAADDVIAEYHERLARTDDPVTLGEPRPSPRGYVEVAARILDGRGEQHHQFTESDPMCIHLRIRSRIATPPIVITITITDELGRAIGGRTTPAFALSDDENRVIEWRLTDHPLRNGLFQVEVGASDASSGETIVSPQILETFAIYGQAADCDGPVQLRGTLTS